LLCANLAEIIKSLIISGLSSILKYWVVRKIRAAKDLNLINEIKNFKNLKNLNFSSAFQFSFKISTNFPDNPILQNSLDI